MHTYRHNNRKALAAIAVLLAFGFGATRASADWPQLRGPNGDGISQETDLLEQWPEGGPPLVWKATGIGTGMGAVSVADGRVYTSGDLDGKSWLFALDEAGGAHVWRAEVGRGGPIGFGSQFHPGPRGTPTVDGDKLYILGQFGDLVCFTTGGEEVWRANLVDDHGGQTPRWGYSESPLIDGDKLIVTPGGADGVLLALDKNTGAPLWQSEGWSSEEPQYSSPVVATIGGVRQYIQLTEQTVAGIAAKDGRVLWRTSREGLIPVTTPIVEDGLVYITSGYGAGCRLFEVRPPAQSGGKFSVELVYANKDLKNHHGGVILFDGYVYGSNDPGILTAMDFRTGEVAWQDRSVGKGSIAVADGRIYLRAEQSPGQVALIGATPEAYRQISAFTPPDQSGENNWPHPVIANGRLYLRDQDNLLAYDIRSR
jgi:outer membrane protein assembly factor BamB